VGYRVNRLFPDGELDGQMILTPIDEMVAAEVSRVIIRDPDSTSEDFVQLAEKLGLQGTNYFIGWTAWLDLAPEGISKASGLEEVAGLLGVAREHVLAIGDGRNDSEMLEWAGRGVAMGQAPDEVKAVADHVTLPVRQDGAAVELDRWF
jgi:hydroxymethylpyrimidine pyrophosphatase-like HAD family hydrolase